VVRQVPVRAREVAQVLELAPRLQLQRLGDGADGWAGLTIE
jgi:hypothetical protein